MLFIILIEELIMKISPIIILSLLLLSCSKDLKNTEKNGNIEIDSAIAVLEEDDQVSNVYYKDLDRIKEDGVLRAITIYSGTSYFLYKGRPMGFEYELLERLADDLGLKLEIIIAKNNKELFKMLNQGDGDIVAHGMTVTEPRKNFVSFSNYHFLTHQVLVQRKPDNWRRLKAHQIKKRLVTNPIDLIGDTVSVRAKSSYFHRLKNLSSEIGGRINIDTLVGGITTEELIEMVVDKRIKYTVADNNIALINSSYYPELDINTPISFSQRISWAVRKNSPQLLQSINSWIDKMKKLR
jgi:membrane-bound lytic murein transglycosylase F